jgi:hypothetical protein
MAAVAKACEDAERRRVDYASRRAWLRRCGNFVLHDAHGWTRMDTAENRSASLS